MTPGPARQNDCGAAQALWLLGLGSPGYVKVFPAKKILVGGSRASVVTRQTPDCLDVLEFGSRVGLHPLPLTASPTTENPASRISISVRSEPGTDTYLLLTSNIKVCINLENKPLLTADGGPGHDSNNNSHPNRGYSAIIPVSSVYHIATGRAGPKLRPASLVQPSIDYDKSLSTFYVTRTSFSGPPLASATQDIRATAVAPNGYLHTVGKGGPQPHTF